MASLSCTLLVLIAAFGLINGVPTKTVTTKTTKVTHTAGHPPFVSSTTHTTQTHNQFPYIYAGTGPSSHVTTSVAAHQQPHPYPYVYGYGPSPYMPYMYGWQSPYTNYMPSYGYQQYGYPPSPYGNLYGGGYY